MSAAGAALPQAFHVLSKARDARLARYDLARPGTLDRHLSIPNPISHFGLAVALENDWAAIKTLFGASKYSLSKPIRSRRRALAPRQGHNQLEEIRSGYWGLARFVLRTDISRFYESIYTHSISWAAHGKTVAKANRWARQPYWGNIIDRWVQKSQDGQTYGIPIGPDSSLIISEIILCAADSALSARLPSQKGFHHYDDFDFPLDSRDQGEVVLNQLQASLAEYELALNPQKTRILELPQSISEPWILELTAANPVRTSGKSQSNDLMKLFDRAFALVNRYPTKPILKFVFGGLRRQNIEPANWKVYQTLLVRALSGQPDIIDRVVTELSKYRSKGYPLDLGVLEAAFNNHILVHGPRGHSNEVAWAVFALIQLGRRVHDDAMGIATQMDNSFVALLTMDAEQRGLATPGATFAIWNTVMTGDELYGENWLFAYEANIQGWMPTMGGGDHVVSDPNFRELKTRGVYFYDINRGLPRRVRDSDPY